MSRNFKLIAIAVVGAGVLGGGFFYWQQQAKKGGAGAPAAQQAAGKAGPQGGFAINVEAVKVKLGSLPRQLTTVGSLKANENVVIRAEIPGRIARLNFQEGQKAAKGQLLVKLDDSTHVAALEEAKANLVLSQANLERAAKLLKQGAGTEKSKDEAYNKFVVDKAKVDSAKASLEKTSIFAPFDGVVGLRDISVGAYVTAGQDIANLQNVDPIKVDFRLPEIHLGLLREGQAVTVSSDAFPGRQFTGEIYAIDPQIDPVGRSVQVRAKVANAEGQLHAGLFVRVEVQVSEALSVMMIPEEALVPRGADLFVFRIVDGKAASVAVKVGTRRQGMAQILEGLAPDDDIVTAGQIKLRDGTPVMVVPAGGKGT